MIDPYPLLVISSPSIIPFAGASRGKPKAAARRQVTTTTTTQTEPEGHGHSHKRPHRNCLCDLRRHRFQVRYQNTCKPILNSIYADFGGWIHPVLTIIQTEVLMQPSDDDYIAEGSTAIAHAVFEHNLEGQAESMRVRPGPSKRCARTKIRKLKSGKFERERGWYLLSGGTHACS